MKWLLCSAQRLPAGSPATLILTRHSHCSVMLANPSPADHCPGCNVVMCLTAGSGCTRAGRTP